MAPTLLEPPRARNKERAAASRQPGHRFVSIANHLKTITFKQNMLGRKSKPKSSKTTEKHVKKGKKAQRNSQRESPEIDALEADRFDSLTEVRETTKKRLVTHTR